MNIEERFWSKTKTSTEHSYNGTPCIDWTAGKQRGGYGRFVLRHGLETSSHRFAYQLEHGTIPDGMYVCHHCDRPCCVNSEHLFLGTHQDNMDDRSAKGRTSRLIGSSNAAARLTVSDVFLIKMFLQRHPPRKGQAGGQCLFLARWFGVGSRAITEIKSGRNWAHVKAEGVAS
ncbi:MAG: HNH endonuclease signature motif containing protein [Pirellulales bacterium]